MTRCVFAIPGSLDNPAGSYAYARKILPLLSKRIDTKLCALPSGFPFPSEADLAEAARIIAAEDLPGTVFLIDGLAFGAMPADLIAAIGSPIAALVHHPLALEEGLAPADKERLLTLEGQALAFARMVIVPSAGTAGALKELFGIDGAKIAIAWPGVLRGERAPGAPAGAPLHIVSAGSLTPRKGFSALADALGELNDLPWHATIAGSAELSPDTAQKVRHKILSYGLQDRVRFAGNLDEKALSALYSSGDIFALASYYEGYGMVYAEAMAHGLPIVASGGGAVAHTVPSEAGFVCPAGDAKAITNALRILLLDENIRRAKAKAAWRHGQTLPQWSYTAAAIADALAVLGGTRT
jgi:glycosyltransferase involved in cell wall biosynthesis